MSPSAGGMWATAAMLRILRNNLASTTKMATKLIRSKLSATRLTVAELQPIALRNTARQPIHPAAWLRQQKRAGGGAKWFSTANISAAVRRYLSTAGAGHPNASGRFRFDRSKLPTSNTSRGVAQLTGRAPFASTLRPNLTGGALPRTAGGYGMPGCGRTAGARYFSHTPAAPAEIVQNVSQAMRVFWLSGQRARYDGVSANGEKRYRAVSAAQEEARVRMEVSPLRAPGSFIDFKLSPTITALGPLGVALPFEAPKGSSTLNESGFLDVLSVDFARALKELSGVMNDLQRLSGLGDLPITLEKNNVLRVRFPGVDPETVMRLCEDVGVERGVIHQDPDFDASAGVPVALQFPFAPEESDAEVLSSPGGSLRSHDSASSGLDESFIMKAFGDNPWCLSSTSDPEDIYSYQSLRPSIQPVSNSEEQSFEEFEGLEGIHRFIEECDRVRARF
ncbi:hypothetical protein QBC35DRAFT_481845 [Podospora australis]|uniref:Casein kinase II beta 2 subunit n=1 Tax=Podospora australis TaxID=1536484 RepID=A0AAN6X409_9PEZI|nr:hypothetical protein QBC35DRAFT_481845 [Podospora australis]